jgi:hypothetical protein
VVEALRDHALARVQLGQPPVLHAPMLEADGGNAYEGRSSR